MLKLKLFVFSHHTTRTITKIIKYIFIVFFMILVGIFSATLFYLFLYTTYFYKKVFWPQLDTTLYQIRHFSSN